MDVDAGTPRAEVVLVRDGEELGSWPLRGSGPPDLALVDQLARLQLAARREGFSIRLRRACPDLVALLALAGLSDVIPAG